MAACIALFGLALLAPTAALCAELSGTTRNQETNEPLAFVTVQVKGRTTQGGEISRGIMSLADGHYFMATIPLGNYTVIFSRIGYETRTDTLVVDADIEYTIHVALKVQPIVIDEIIVVEDRYKGIEEVQPSFISIEAEELSRLPGIIEGDPIRALQMLPGVQAASEFSSGLYVRGGGPDQTLVLLDQVAIYNPTHAFGFFSSFNADALSKVNLYKGAYPAQHGGRLGAVLEVSTKEGNRKGVAGRFGISTIATRIQLDGPVGGRGTWMVSGRRTHLDPLLAAIRRQGEDIPDYFFYDFNGKMTLKAGKGRVTISAYNGNDNLLLEIDRDNTVELDWGNSLASAVYKRPVGDGLLLSGRVYWSRYKSESGIQALTTPILFSNEIRDLTALADLVWEMTPSQTITSGVMASQYDVSYFQEFNHDPQINYQQSPYELAAFVEDKWTPFARTIAQLGLRVRYLEDGSRVLWEPRVSLSRGVSDRVRVKLGGGVYHQYLQLIATEGLSATDFYVPIDETTYPGRSVQFVGGVEFDPTPTYRTSVELYFTNLANLVTFNNRVAADEPFLTAADIFHTDGEGWATGVELFARKQIGQLTGWLGYTLGWTRRTFADLNRGNQFPPKYDRRHDINAVARYHRGPWTYGAAFILASGQAFTPASARYWLPNPATGGFPDNSQVLPADRNSARLLAYHRLDLNVTRDFSMFGLDADWQIQIFNAYSRRNEWFVQYEADEEIIKPSVVKMLPIIPSFGINVRF